jgi:L-idonate 5-dehydrogenase
MRAVIAHAAKDLRIETVSVPDLGPKDVRIRMKAGGICGSDLHYYLHGGFGTVRLREPMVLGHEISGTVEAAGSSVTRVAIGDLVAVNPSRPCNQCLYCLEGEQHHCLDMRFFGSAMRFPHVQGGFREVLVCDEAQAFPVAASLSAGEAAMAEPLAVCLHAVRQAGSMLGKKVLVTGAGPIGALAVLAARRAGATEIVATDIDDAPLRTVAKIGADRVINVAKDGEALSAYAKDKGYFDILLEASGNGAALTGAFSILRPGATIVQIGLGGDVPLSINTIVAKEITLRGSFRFHAEFGMAVELMGKGLIDVKPLISAEFPFTEATKAFETATDRSRSMKVQLSFA